MMKYNRRRDPLAQDIIQTAHGQTESDEQDFDVPADEQDFDVPAAHIDILQFKLQVHSLLWVNNDRIKRFLAVGGTFDSFDDNLTEINVHLAALNETVQKLNYERQGLIAG